MILLPRHRFTVADYHQRHAPEQAGDDLSQGLVMPVALQFEEWPDGEVCPAEAFLDPGADSTGISLRWINEQAAAAGRPGAMPKIRPYGRVVEKISLLIGEQRLPLGNSDRPVWLGTQGDEADSFPPLPGCEDILLGRDFITQHGLVVLIDGEQCEFSILAPLDPANRQQRERIWATFEHGEPGDPSDAGQ